MTRQAAALDSSHIFDLLVVGGGPGGTAAALRAKELGLDVLVIDFDDLMRRIRDYSKEKLILPSFGGGDRMAFPKGGECISCLPFEPIDKDEMCRQWKDLYSRFDVRYRLGIELTGLTRLQDGGWEIATWDHGAQGELSLLARHVVIGIGRGVPRRFDIPGNTDGIARRLTDPQVFVGQPACVIGGGTSAAEAVIAISNAKIAAGDGSDVYWSYRGDKMPRVSKALAEVFFEAYVGNGNIRYFRRSEPTAVIVGDDHTEYLAIRVDRRPMSERPSETTHLEFPKSACVACIGEELPVELLSSLGIHRREGGPRGRERMVVTPHLETELPNVFLVGDILSQAYFETEDFGAGASAFREVTHRGNIKSALRDGVLVAAAIHQRLEGREGDAIVVEDAEDRLSRESRVIALLSGSVREEPERTPSRPPDDRGPFLVGLLQDGILGEEHGLLQDTPTTIGRRSCVLEFSDDQLLDERHASVSLVGGAWVLKDEGGATGVFLRVPATTKRTVAVGDLICAGHQFFVLADTGDGVPMLVQYEEGGREVGRHSIEKPTTLFGRGAPDVLLDPDDLSLSRRHFAISVVSDGTVCVKDLKSVNGTYVRVRQEITLTHGMAFRLGRQLIGFGESKDKTLDFDWATPPVSSPCIPVLRPAAEGVATPGAAATGPSVAFRNRGVTIQLGEHETVCEAAERNGVPIVAECHSGICGSDPVRIVGGAENVAAPASPGEVETLEDICGLDSQECRLACMMRVRGPVEVEIIDD